VKIISINEIKEQPNYPYFYLKEYTSFVKKTESRNVIIFADEFNTTIVCNIWINKFLKIIQPLYPPLAKNGERLSKQQEFEFLNKWIRFLIKNKITHRIVQPENFAIFKSVPENSKFAPFGTYYINLDKNTEQELFQKIHPKHRNVIRNAEKHNMILKYGIECIDDFYLLYQQTMKRSNMFCHDISYFNNFFTYLNQSVICGVVYFESKPQGGIFIPYTKYGAFYLYGASAEKIEINGSINYLHWKTIKYLKKKGVKRYDFVGARLSDVSGTKLDGIQQFKKRFGAELEEGFLWKMDLNNNKCNIYDALLNVKTKLKGREIPLDIIDQENRKAYAK
jgi:hypothetical protein